MAKKTWIDNLPKPKSEQQDHDAPASQYGRKVRVYSSGRKVWFIRGRVRGADASPKFIMLGDYPLLSEEDAELEAGQKRKLLRQGIDPNQQRDDEVIANRVEGMTFGDVTEEYLEKATSTLREITLRGRRYALRGHHFADWRKRKLAYITQERVDALAATLPVTSHAVVLGALRRVLRYAEDHGYIERVPTVKVKKADGDAAPFFSFQEDDDAPPDFIELVLVLDALDILEQQNPFTPWPVIWRFAALTGARPSAYLGLRWEELDLSSKPVWRLPAGRSKLKRDINIPLSEAAAALLRSLPRKESGLIWPGRDGTRPRSDLPGDQVGLIRGMLAARGHRQGFWPGRFRDTMMTWLDVQPHASERAIALIVDHKAPSERTTRGHHYVKIKSDQLARKLVNEWAATIEKAREVARRAGPVVMQMQRRKKA